LITIRSSVQNIALVEGFPLISQALSR